MSISEQIQSFIASQSPEKQNDLLSMHRMMLNIQNNVRLWFESGIDSNNKVISNPNIGYGQQTLQYANGKSREYFQLSFSTNTTGISIYLIGLKDKNYLNQTFGNRLGKAKITGYCIKFKSLKDIDLETLKDVLKFGLGQ